ncbi:hypothetical protein ACH5RR_041496 [Cinchona calisaya]|uniref:Reverse transcriptase zinc-binding domain-containing protein n=1 Tax=Cinchona calisaya TaxID=153742 RepID=A0ABD2XTU3_9GENT
MKTADNGAESSRANQQTSLWNFTLGLKIKQKIKHFIWKCLNRILPTDAIFHSRIGKGTPNCTRCDKRVETTEHIFFFCEHADTIWKMAQLKWDGLEDTRNDFLKWWDLIRMAIEERNDQEATKITAFILWHI